MKKREKRIKQLVKNYESFVKKNYINYMYNKRQTNGTNEMLFENGILIYK